MASKRKSIIAATADDMKFEEEELTNESRSKRVKKSKAIYDPSIHNKPLSKRKLEALAKLEEQQVSTKSPKKEVTPVAETSSKINRRSENVNPAKVRRSQSKVPAEPDHKASPSKRQPVKKESAPKPPTPALSSGQHSQEVVSSTVSSQGIVSDEIPNVARWSCHQVYEYFVKLGFSRADASIFKEHEIDGETLLIMSRDDIVSKNFKNLKLGTALKMWKHICSFQTRKNDPTQTWKCFKYFHQ